MFTHDSFLLWLSLLDKALVNGQTTNGDRKKGRRY